MEALEYKINASITGLVKTIFSLWINMCIDDWFIHHAISNVRPWHTTDVGIKQTDAR